MGVTPEQRDHFIQRETQRALIKLMEKRAKLQREKATTARAFADLPFTKRLLSPLPRRMADMDEQLADLDEIFLRVLREGL